jgi:hypothetical protein
MEQGKIETSRDQAITFQIFAANLKATSAQLEKAYLSLCGVDETPIEDPVVQQLKDEMDTLSKKGFPINRFARMIEEEQRLEKHEEEYLRYVNALPITEKEKQVLWSIISKQREGKLELFKNGTLFATLEVQQNRARHIIASQLWLLLEAHVSKVSKTDKLSIAFIESD